MSRHTSILTKFADSGPTSDRQHRQSTTSTTNDTTNRQRTKPLDDDAPNSTTHHSTRNEATKNAPTQLGPMPSEGRQPRHPIPTPDTQRSSMPDTGLQHSILDLDTRCWTVTPETEPRHPERLLPHSILDLDTLFWHQHLLAQPLVQHPPLCNTPSWHFRWRAVLRSRTRQRVRHQWLCYQNTHGGQRRSSYSPHVFAAIPPVHWVGALF